MVKAHTAKFLHVHIFNFPIISQFLRLHTVHIMKLHCIDTGLVYLSFSSITDYNGSKF